MENRFEAQPKYTRFVQNTSAAAIDDDRYKLSAVPAPADYADGGIPLPSSDTSLAPGDNSEGFGF